MYITPELPAQLEAELVSLLERETKLALQRTNERDVRKHRESEWIPRYKLLREEENGDKYNIIEIYLLLEHKNNNYFVLSAIATKKSSANEC